MSEAMSNDLEYFGRDGFGRYGKTTELGAYHGPAARGRYVALVGALSCMPGSMQMERRTVDFGGTPTRDARIYTIGEYDGAVHSRVTTQRSNEDVVTVTHEIVESKPGWGGTDAAIAVEYDETQQPPRVAIYELGETVGEALRDQIAAHAAAIQAGQQ